MRNYLLVALLLLLAGTYIACGGNATEQEQTTTEDQTEVTTEQTEQAAGESEATVHGEGKEYNSAYVCPMHCEGSGSTEPGKCPVCGMDYVPLAEHIENGHDHNEAGGQQ